MSYGMSITDFLTNYTNYPDMDSLIEGSYDQLNEASNFSLTVQAIAEDAGIPVEVRKITVTEVVAAAKSGTLKEMFGAGTAAVISPISAFGFRDTDYELPELEDSYGTRFKKIITDIQYNLSEDKFGWRFKV
jgi:branched-chain amino acid aminotransferase